ncbi:MAG: pilus assembly protein PilP [Porticoccaceae bacterium]|nr:MAG: pilus assembly protein PilP [Porticoccaceae bacterium]
MLGELYRQLRETELSELTFDNIGVWPPVFRILALLALFALLLLAAWYFHVRDLEASLAQAQGQELRLRKTFEEKAFEAANLEAYRKQMAQIEAAFQALLAQLPSDTEVPGLLEDITDIGLGSSLEIESIALEPERAAEYYAELPIRIVARGGYHDIGAFVSGISSLPRIVTLHDYKIDTVGEGGRLRFEVEAKTYRYQGSEGGE